METGVLIAVISAVGVIGSAIVQWRSNVRTLESSATSLEKEREYRAEQSIRDADERRKIREEDREADAARIRSADQARWLEKRQELHEAAIAKLPNLMNEARISMTTSMSLARANLPEGDEPSYFDLQISRFSKALTEVTGDLTERESQLELYGSDTSSKAYSTLVALMSSLSLEIDWYYHPNAKAYVGEEAQELHDEISKRLEELEQAYATYVTAARSDLRTDR